MKRAALALAGGLLFVFTSITFAQAPDTFWTRTYGGTNSDGG